MTSQTLGTVRLVEFPLEVYRRSTQHIEELRREFALMSMRVPERTVPVRLLHVIDELTNRYGAFTATPNEMRDQALARGETMMEELVYQVPTDVVDACLGLSTLLDDADEFCRKGELLTLASPREAVAFRRWYLGEFVAQLRGLPPLPWRDDLVDALAADPRLRGAP